MPFEMSPIPPAHNCGWVQSISDGFFRFTSKFGTLTFGLRPEGYDSWTYKPAGGAVTIPWTRKPESGEIIIGLIPEDRPNLGGRVLCAIGGIIEPAEKAFQTQYREADEEAGIDTYGAHELGLPTVTDRLFWVVDLKTGEGCNKNYGWHIPFEWLEPTERGWKFRADAPLKDMKKASQVRFYTWRMAAAETQDGIALTAIMQLLTLAL